MCLLMFSRPNLVESGIIEFLFLALALKSFPEFAGDVEFELVNDPLRLVFYYNDCIYSLDPKNDFQRLCLQD